MTSTEISQNPSSIKITGKWGQLISNPPFEGRANPCAVTVPSNTSSDESRISDVIIWAGSRPKSDPFPMQIFTRFNTAVGKWGSRSKRGISRLPETPDPVFQDHAQAVYDPVYNRVWSFHVAKGNKFQINAFWAYLPEVRELSQEKPSIWPWKEASISGTAPAADLGEFQCALYGRMVFFISSTPDKLGKVWIFDIDSCSWSSVECAQKPEEMPPMNLWSFSAKLYQNNIIVSGGEKPKNPKKNPKKREPNTAVWSFNIDTRKWSELKTNGRGPSNAIGAYSVIVNTLLIVYGGGGNDSNVYSLDLESRPGVPHPWKCLTIDSSAPIASSGGYAALVHANTLYVDILFTCGALNNKQNSNASVLLRLQGPGMNIQACRGNVTTHFVDPALQENFTHLQSHTHYPSKTHVPFMNFIAPEIYSKLSGAPTETDISACFPPFVYADEHQKDRITTALLNFVHANVLPVHSLEPTEGTLSTLDTFLLWSTAHFLKLSFLEVHLFNILIGACTKICSDAKTLSKMQPILQIMSKSKDVENFHDGLLNAMFTEALLPADISEADTEKVIDFTMTHAPLWLATSLAKAVLKKREHVEPKAIPLPNWNDSIKQLHRASCSLTPDSTNPELLTLLPASVATPAATPSDDAGESTATTVSSAESITVHKPIAAVRCSFVSKALQRDNTISSLSIPVASKAALAVLVHYWYTGHLPAASANPSEPKACTTVDAMDILVALRSFDSNTSNDALRNACLDVIRTRLNVQNSLTILGRAFNLKLDDVVAFVISFVARQSSHITAEDLSKLPAVELSYRVASKILEDHSLLYVPQKAQPKTATPKASPSAAVSPKTSKAVSSPPPAKSTKSSPPADPKNSKAPAAADPKSGNGKAASSTPGSKAPSMKKHKSGIFGKRNK